MPRMVRPGVKMRFRPTRDSGPGAPPFWTWDPSHSPGGQTGDFFA